MIFLRWFCIHSEIEYGKPNTSIELTLETEDNGKILIISEEVETPDNLDEIIDLTKYIINNEIECEWRLLSYGEKGDKFKIAIDSMSGCISYVCNTGTVEHQRKN